LTQNQHYGFLPGYCLLSNTECTTISLLLTFLKLVPLGKNCRIRPFVFSLISRSQEEYRLQKYVFADSFFAIFSW